MRSLPLPLKVGNINLKGKKSCLLKCKCCTAQNLKEKSENERHRREIKREIESFGV